MTARRVFLVDDDAAVREALAGLLKLHGFAVRGFASGPALLEAVDGLGDGCLVLDLRMPEMSGLEVQAELGRRRVELPVVFLTAHGDVPTGVTAMKFGAVDFLQKPVREAALLEALERAFSTYEAGAEARATARRARELLDRLTGREREVMGLVVEGLRNREIAERLGISLQTVKVHRMRGMAKLELDSLLALQRVWESGDS